MDFGHALYLLLLAASAANLMILAGMGKSALEPRRRRRTCPSCGRATSDCSCRG
jgi:hypothetical protein